MASHSLATTPLTRSDTSETARQPARTRHRSSAAPRTTSRADSRPQLQFAPLGATNSTRTGTVGTGRPNASKLPPRVRTPRSATWRSRSIASMDPGTDNVLAPTAARRGLSAHIGFW